MFPFFRKIHLIRSTLQGTSSEEVLDFYVTKLGMYLTRTLYDSKNNTTSYLFEYGKSQLEVVCRPELKNLPEQSITIACNNHERLKKRLSQHGIDTSDYASDPYTELRTFSIKGPDNVIITIIEE